MAKKSANKTKRTRETNAKIKAEYKKLQKSGSVEVSYEVFKKRIEQNIRIKKLKTKTVKKKLNQLESPTKAKTNKILSDAILSKSEINKSIKDIANSFRYSSGELAKQNFVRGLRKKFPNEYYEAYFKKCVDSGGYPMNLTQQLQWERNNGKNGMYVFPGWDKNTQDFRKYGFDIEESPERVTIIDLGDWS